MIVFCIVAEILFFFGWCTYCYLQCPRSAILITSAEIVIPFIYLMYSIIAPIFFIVEGKSLADRFFYISKDTMQKTCLLYLIVYVVFLLCLFLKNSGKKINRKQVDWLKQYPYGLVPLWCDLIAVAIIIYYIIRVCMAGTSWTTLDTLSKRELVSSEYISYLNIYMVAYTNKLVITWLIKKKKSNIQTVRLIIPISFWIIYLYVTSRRYFLMVLPAIIMALIASEYSQKLSKKWLAIGGGSVIALLTLGARRAFLKLSKLSLVYYLHNTFAEFIYTYYTSCFFVGHSYELQYGKTYILDTLTQWIPRFIYSSKPLDMSIRFWNMAHTNVAYSFSPIAEGLYNFGWGAVIAVPIVLLLYVELTNYVIKYSSVLYLTFLANFVGFMRGNVSNCVMDLIMITLLMMIMNINGPVYRIYKRKNKE